jgi:hypothetical protein
MQFKHTLAVLRADRGKLVVALVVAAVLALGSVTFGSWVVGGTGNAYSKATSSQNLTTVDATASTTASLYPGGSGSVTLSISNPNPFAVTVTGVAASGAIAADGAHVTACTAGLHKVTFTDQTGLSITIAASSTATVVTLPGTPAAMGTTSDNGCQGATFTIPVTLTATS